MNSKGSVFSLFYTGGVRARMYRLFSAASALGKKKMFHLSRTSDGVAADFCALNEVVSHKENSLGKPRYSNSWVL